MLSLAQKLVAIGTIVAIQLVVFVFSPLLAILGLFASGPLAFAILAR